MQDLVKITKLNWIESLTLNDRSLSLKSLKEKKHFKLWVYLLVVAVDSVSWNGSPVLREPEAVTSGSTFVGSGGSS